MAEPVLSPGGGKIKPPFEMGVANFDLGREFMWDYRDMTGTRLWYNDERGGEYFNLKGITSGGVLRLDT